MVPGHIPVAPLIGIEHFEATRRLLTVAASSTARIDPGPIQWVAIPAGTPIGASSVTVE